MATPARSPIPHTAVALVGVLAVALVSCSADGEPRDLSPAAVASASSPAPPSTAPVKTWQYVAMGDSTHRDVATSFARLIEAELGVEVDTRAWINPDLASYEVGGERAGDLVERLRTDEDLRSDIREAEIVTFVVPYGSFIDVCGNPFDLEPVGAQAYLRECWPEFLSGYRSDVDAFFDELVALRSPSDAAIRVVDHYQTAWGQLHALGVYGAVRPFWQEMNAAIAAAAAEHGIPVVHAYDAMNGPGGRTDGVAAGYVNSDEVHLTVEGAELVAGMLGDLGFEPELG